MTTFTEEPKTTRHAPAAASMISRAAAGRSVRRSLSAHAEGMPDGPLRAGHASSDHDCNCGAGRGARQRMVQAKLTINTPGDAYEREADSIAARVISMTTPTAGASPAHSAVVGVQTMSAREHDADAMEAPPIVYRALTSAGQPLDRAARRFMEPRFGWDFSAVRVHTDAGAAMAARSIGARAFTSGRDIVFGAGEYAPGTNEGRSLLAHELTHVVQQGSGAARHGGGGALPGVHVAAGQWIQRKEWPWPFNGYVDNKSNEAVTVWNDQRNLYTIPAKSTSGYWTEDVDHIRDKNGQWYKVGPNRVTVHADGSISGYSCKVSGPGQPCPESKKVTRFVDGSYMDENGKWHPGNGPKF